MVVGEAGGRKLMCNICLESEKAIGLFPCFTRGVNLYKEEDVESSAIAGAVGAPADETRIYGMFAHGELGPSTFSGFAREATAAVIEHEQHSILAMHTREAAGAAKDEV